VATVSTNDDIRLLAPLIAGEALWLGFDAPQSARITGASSTGDSIDITQIGGFHNGRGLFAADSVATSKGARAIDEALVATGTESEGLSLVFDIVTPMRSRRLVVAFTTIDHFARITGVTPQERDLGEAYRGSLLS
jgi:hypothetical protein